MNQVITKLWADESGDCGFKFNNGSSRFLVIVVVYFTNTDNFENRINQLKIELPLSKGYEFKFSRCKDKIKKDFLKLITESSIQYKAIFVDKKKVKEPGLKFQPQQLYCELVRRLLYDNNPPIEKATLVIDEAAAKIHHKEFNWVLKKYLSKNIIAKIQQKRSKSELMIQAADMIAGSIFRKYEKGDNRYHQMIRNKEKTLIEF